MTGPDATARHGLELERLSAALEMLRDDHDRLAAAYQRTQAESQAKDRLIARVSHELRTPMNGILGITGLTLETPLNEEQRRYLQMVWSSADALITIVNDLLDHAKLEAGKLQIERIPFNLPVMLSETVAALHVTGEEKGVPVTLLTTPSVPSYVCGDPARLRQIVINLVGNALKFTSSGEITVTADAETRDDGATVLSIAVADTGIGIPPDRLDAIFDPYEQAAASTSRQYGGTGLGLTICAQLSRAMGGGIDVESEVGKGSTFRFTVRVEEAEPPGAPTEISGVARVLAAGDSEAAHHALVDALAGDRFSLLFVDDPAEVPDRLAVAVDAGEPFDVVVLHLREDAVARLETFVEPAGDARVVVITPAGQRGDAARCRELGVAGYLTGSLSSADVVAAVTAVHSGVPDLVTRHWLNEQVRRLRVLVVDDSATNRLLASRLVEKQGHEVVVATDGESALAALSERCVDIVLLDLEMPGMDGFATAAAIRDLGPPCNGVPIAAVTGHVGDEHRTRATEAGMNGFLTKPFRAEELAAVIAELTEGDPEAGVVRTDP